MAHKLFIKLADSKNKTYQVMYSVKQEEDGADLCNDAYHDRPDFPTLCYRLIKGEGLPDNFFDGSVKTVIPSRKDAELTGVSPISEMEEKTIKGLVEKLNELPTFVNDILKRVNLLKTSFK